MKSLILLLFLSMCLGLAIALCLEYAGGPRQYRVPAQSGTITLREKDSLKLTAHKRTRYVLSEVGLDGDQEVVLGTWQIAVQR